MKQTFFMLATMLAITMVSCKGQSEQIAEKSNVGEARVSETPVVQPAVTATGEPVHIDKAGFLKLIMDYEKNPEKWVFQGDKPCVVDFYADWCAPCRITSPILDELAREYAGKINVYKVDVDKEQELAAVFGIRSIPSFLFCPQSGQPTMSSGIAATREETKAMFIRQIEELLLGNKPAAL